jgi:hypothetical protein
MRMRSTGLGKAELEGDVAGLEIVDDLLILHVQTTKPVRWHVRTGVQRRDIFCLVKLLISFKMLKYLFRLGKRNTREPDAF